MTDPSASERRFRVGPYSVRLRTRVPEVRRSIDHLYAHYPRPQATDFIDFDVAIRRRRGGRWGAAQTVFTFEGTEPFNPLPGDQGLPLLEWGLNWCVYSLCHQHLTLHAAVLERSGRAVIIPAPSGSGKSTLCAGLAFSGWRMLSDEFALICPHRRALLPHPRPISLKNASIDVIRRFAPQAAFGSLVHDTLKGTVGHVRAPDSAVRCAGDTAEPAWIVFPRYVASIAPRWARVERARAFMQLVENAYNYDVFGPSGFELLGSVVDRSQCFTFEYGDLAEAVRLFERLSRNEDVTRA